MSRPLEPTDEFKALEPDDFGDLANLRLTSGKVTLRVYTPDDLPAVARIMMVPCGYFGYTAVYPTLEEVRERHFNPAMEGLEKREEIPFVILWDEQVVGVIHLREVNLKYAKATIQSFIIDPGLRGHQIGTKAVRLVVEWAMSVEFRLIKTQVVKENIPSRKVFGKSNFRCTGMTEKEFLSLRGQFEDHVEYAVRSDNWSIRRSESDDERESLITNS